MLLGLTPVDGTQVRIVRPDPLRACGGDGEVGEIWVSGPSVCGGYWNDPESSTSHFAVPLEGTGSYLRTGDLGFMHLGRLHITGSLKDLIILRGRSVYPTDVEEAAIGSHDEFAGCTRRGVRLHVREGVIDSLG